MKIKQFINEKPRLKKALKTIVASVTIFFAAFGVVCSGLLVGSCANQKAKEVVATTPLYKEKPIQNSFTFNQYDFYTMTDLFSNEAMANYINWVYRADNINLYTITENYSRGFTCNSYMYFTTNDNITSSNIDIESTRLMTIQSLTLFANVPSHPSTNNTAQFFTLRFTSSTNTNQYLEIPFYYIVNNSLGTTRNWYTGSIRYTTNNGSSWAVATANRILVVEYTAQVISWTRAFLPYNITEDSSFRNGYDQGYDIGYNEGYIVGYDIGSTGVSSNPFNLISNAFTSLASILNIEVLPNLSLGVLIFTPLVVTIIVVIVKMFKG